MDRSLGQPSQRMQPYALSDISVFLCQPAQAPRGVTEPAPAGERTARA